MIAKRKHVFSPGTFKGFGKTEFKSRNRIQFFGGQMQVNRQIIDPRQIENQISRCQIGNHSVQSHCNADLSSHRLDLRPRGAGDWD